MEKAASVHCCQRSGQGTSEDFPSGSYSKEGDGVLRRLSREREREREFCMGCSLESACLDLTDRSWSFFNDSESDRSGSCSRNVALEATRSVAR